MLGQNIISLKGSCQHKNLVYSCKNSTPDLKQNCPYFTGLTEHTFKDRICKHSTLKRSTSKYEYESRRNSTELPNFICGKKKEKINMDFDRSILDKAKTWFEKLHVLSFREIPHHFLHKESVE